MIPLKDVTPSAHNNITTQFIILDKGRTAKESSQAASAAVTCLALVADETAAVHFQFWGDECHAFRPGDILRLTNGIFAYGNRNNLVLRAGKRGSIEKVGEFTMNYVETPNISEIKWVPDAGGSNKYVQESIVSQYSRIFPPLR